jgi:hypothetical protein
MYGTKRTRVKVVMSPHNYGLTFDAVLVVDEEPVGNYHQHKEVWDAPGEIGTDLGLVRGGAWTRFKDSPHVEFKHWNTQGQKL